jgi:hypothetical protein
MIEQIEHPMSDFEKVDRARHDETHSKALPSSLRNRGSASTWCWNGQAPQGCSWSTVG